MNPEKPVRGSLRQPPRGATVRKKWPKLGRVLHKSKKFNSFFFGIYLFCIIPYTLESLLAVMPPSHHRCTQFLERLWNSQQLTRFLRDSSKLRSLRSKRACHCARSTMDCLSLSARDRPVRRGQWAKTEPAVALIVRAGWPNMATRLDLTYANYPRRLSISIQPFAAARQHPSPRLALTFIFRHRYPSWTTADSCP